MDMTKLKFDSNGLIPCITQDYRDGRVLMLAYMNAESIERTLREKKACYFSRSRNKLWLKGEESGNVQHVKELFIDCDGDTVLIKVEQKGGCACHKGYRSCFFRKWEEDGFKKCEEVVKDPGSMYSK
ncbi:MAG: phosphoribosyl-AMP cyclohydrolase [Elusimicrobiota bacterium]